MDLGPLPYTEMPAFVHTEDDLKASTSDRHHVPRLGPDQIPARTGRTHSVYAKMALRMQLQERAGLSFSNDLHAAG